MDIGLTCLIIIEFQEKTIITFMVFINVKELSRLIENTESARGLDQALIKFQQNYGSKLLWEEYETLVDLAIKINKREKGKSQNSKHQSVPVAQIFTYGEYKLFVWSLFLYCFLKRIELIHLEEADFQYFSKIFRQKTQPFLKYQVHCVRWNREKYIREWEEAELELFQNINNTKTIDDWKNVSYTMFVQSEGRFFRPFQQCRERWINYQNPSVKKGDWTIEQDVELFSLVVQFGCRWALLSRELNGTRSEHSIKNRYNSVLKSMRKQYKITSSQQVEEKILKYLRFRANRKTKGSSAGENELNLSSDSKISRERSREVNLEEDRSRSDISQEVINERGSLFSGVFEINTDLIHTPDEEEGAIQNKILNLYVSDETPEDKQLKRTWEEEYEIIDGQISIGKKEDFEGDNWWLNSLDGTPGKQMFPIGLDTLLKAEQPDNIQPILEISDEFPDEIMCGRFEKMMAEDWLFQGRWDHLDE